MVSKPFDIRFSSSDRVSVEWNENVIIGITYVDRYVGWRLNRVFFHVD